MASLPPVEEKAIVHRVKRFWDFAQLCLALSVWLSAVGMAMPSLFEGKVLWASGSFLVSVSTIERAYFDIKRLANPHGQWFQPHDLKKYRAALLTERVFSHAWLAGTATLIASKWFNV